MAENVTHELEKSNIDISTKYKQLMQDTIGEGSLYERAKATLFVGFEQLDLTSTQKATILAEHVASMTNTLSSSAMQTALAWGKEERDGAYELAKIKADTMLATAQKEKAEEEVEIAKEQVNKVKAEVQSIRAASLRENGLYTEVDGTINVSDIGLKYEQTQQVKAAAFQVKADTYRKSGQFDVSDSGVLSEKTSGYKGYTHQQILNAERQRIAYEDSKLNHAANSASSMIGQLLSAEVLSEEHSAYALIWKKAMDGLVTKHSSTDQA